jgi:hypothetical protein
MECTSIMLEELDFGGQNQIVNQQEQQREVNPGGLTQTDSEESLNGKTEETPLTEAMDTTPDLDTPEEADTDPEIEAPLKKQLETLA